MLIPVLIAVTVAVVLITIILIASGLKKGAKTNRADKVASSVQKKGISAVVKEYEKKLLLQLKLESTSCVFSPICFVFPLP